MCPEPLPRMTAPTVWGASSQRLAATDGTLLRRWSCGKNVFGAAGTRRGGGLKRPARALTCQPRQIRGRRSCPTSRCPGIMAEPSPVCALGFRSRARRGSAPAPRRARPGQRRLRGHTSWMPLHHPFGDLAWGHRSPPIGARAGHHRQRNHGAASISLPRPTPEVNSMGMTQRHSRFRKAYEWFRDSQSWEQKERQRGFRDARTGHPPQSSLPSYKSGYAVGSMPTATALPVKRGK